MGYSARILLDSVGNHGKRLTTFELTYPRFVHSEFMTHRVFSRNSASSRAIPVQKMIERVKQDPVVPVWLGKNQPGMQAREEMTPEQKLLFLTAWHDARHNALKTAEMMLELGAHKQIVNRLLEAWMWITVIVSGTTWGNLWNLRTDADAQPEIKLIMEMACDIYHTSKPVEVLPGEWHMPLLRPEDADDILPLADSITARSILARNVSVARVARVSYLTHDGRRDVAKDIELFEKLRSSNHWSPFEHVAMCHPDADHRSGNFTGWTQYRKFFPYENRETFDYAAFVARRQGVSV